MSERVRYLGVVKRFEKTIKHYRAAVVFNRTRLLKRKFRTFTQAKDYGKRFVQRWIELHREA